MLKIVTLERVFINFKFIMAIVFIIIIVIIIVIVIVIVIVIMPTSLINTKSIVNYFVTNSPLAFTSLGSNTGLVRLPIDLLVIIELHSSFAVTIAKVTGSMRLID